MKVLADHDHGLAEGLASVRAEFQVPASFPADVLKAAALAAQRTPSQHEDWRSVPFVTLDPASSTDLDQAFWIEASNADIVLHYAIADVGWFVQDGDPIDAEAWRRGATLYLPGWKAGLYPPVLSEGAASLLPDGIRPAVVFTVRVRPDGRVQLESATRAIIRSRRKLAYESVAASDLPDQFNELARRIHAAERDRGAARVDPPAQELASVDGGGWQLAFTPTRASETSNAAMSLATNLAVADALHAAGTGLFRVMAEPNAAAVSRLRITADALGVPWPAETSLDMFERTLDGRNPRHAALMMAIRRAGHGASYATYAPGAPPWHAAVAATYAHATAPLRRLADRYVVLATLAVANGRPVPGAVSDAFIRLPAVMARSDALAGRIDRAVLDLAEAVLLSGKEGTVFGAVVTDVDERGARLQLCDLPVVTRLKTEGLKPGESVDLRLTAVDLERRTVTFQLA